MFGDDAWPIELKDVPYLQVGPYHTNTVAGLELGSLIAFAIVTETVFAWPGMGKLLIDSINVLDRPVIVAYLLATVCLFILINLLVDLLYAILDPRVRAGDTK